MRMLVSSRVIALLTCCGLLAVLPGCGNDGFSTAPVHGTVTYNGKPLTTGTVLFRPEGDFPTATGEIKPDGTYVLGTYDDDDGAVLGKHAIMVMALEDMANRLPEDRSPTPASIIPERYSHFESSKLTAEIKDEDNVVNLELTK